MSKLSRRELVAAAGVGVLPFTGLTAMALAQTGTPAGTPAGVPSATGVSQDPMIAAELLIMGRKQIEVCRFALERVQNEDVKNFAKAEIEEHETLGRKLQQLGYQYPGVPGVVDGTGTARPVSANLTVGRAALPPGVSDAVTVCHEVAQQCIATQRSEMGKLQGSKLDKRFIGQQLDAHYGLHDHGVVFKRRASAEMQPILAQAGQIIEQHITACKAIMEQLDAGQGQRQPS